MHSFNHGDLIEIDISGATPTFVSVFLSSADLYTGSTENVNGFGSGPGSSLLATVHSGPARANSLSFDDGDITHFDSSNPSGTASRYFDDDVNFASSADIDAVSVLSSNSIAISTLTSESLSGNSIGRGDVVALTHNGSIWVFSETLFEGTSSFGFGSNVNLDAVHVVVSESDTGLLLCMGLLGFACRRKMI